MPAFLLGPELSIPILRSTELSTSQLIHHGGSQLGTLWEIQDQSGEQYTIFSCRRDTRSLDAAFFADCLSRDQQLEHCFFRRWVSDADQSFEAASSGLYLFITGRGQSFYVA